jgi:ABC-type amino acid transport substrate-binding protein
MNHTAKTMFAYACLFSLPATSVAAGTDASAAKTKQSKKKLVFAQTDFPPFIFEKKVQLPSAEIHGCKRDSTRGFGIDMDIAAEAARRADYLPDLVFYPILRVRMLIQEKKVDAAPGLIYSEVNGKPRYKFSTDYDDAGVAVVYQRKDSKEPIKTLSDLANKQLGYVREDAYGIKYMEAIAKGFIKKTDENGAESDLQNFSRLLNNRVDAIIVHHSVGSWLISQNGWTSQVQMTPLRFPYESDPKTNKTYFGFGYHVPDSTLGKFNKALTDMKQDGTIRCIKAQYGVTLLNAE